MTKVVIVLDENGVFLSALADSEVDVAVLKRGTDDRKIEVAESTLEPIE